MVPRVGLEPTRPCSHQILSLACLPIPSSGQIFYLMHISTHFSTILFIFLTLRITLFFLLLHYFSLLLYRLTWMINIFYSTSSFIYYALLTFFQYRLSFMYKYSHYECSLSHIRNTYFDIVLNNFCSHQILSFTPLRGASMSSGAG